MITTNCIRLLVTSTPTLRHLFPTYKTFRTKSLLVQWNQPLSAVPQKTYFLQSLVIFGKLLTILVKSLKYISSLFSAHL